MTSQQPPKIVQQSQLSLQNTNVKHELFIQKTPIQDKNQHHTDQSTQQESLKPKTAQINIIKYQNIQQEITENHAENEFRLKFYVKVDNEIVSFENKFKIDVKKPQISNNTEVVKDQVIKGGQNQMLDEQEANYKEIEQKQNHKPMGQFQDIQIKNLNEEDGKLFQDQYKNQPTAIQTTNLKQQQSNGNYQIQNLTPPLNPQILFPNNQNPLKQIENTLISQDNILSPSNISQNNNNNDIKNPRNFNINLQNNNYQHSSVIQISGNREQDQQNKVKIIVQKDYQTSEAIQNQSSSQAENEQNTSESNYIEQEEEEGEAHEESQDLDKNNQNGQNSYQELGSVQQALAKKKSKSEQKKNSIKNIFNAFKNFIKSSNNEQIVSEYMNYDNTESQQKIREIRSLVSKLKDRNHNKKLIQSILKKQVLNSVFKFFITHHFETWLNSSNLKTIESREGVKELNAELLEKFKDIQ